MYKMYNAQWDEESDDDKNSLNSSFWSDGEREEEEEEIERMIHEEDSQPVADAEDAPREASEAEKPDLNKHDSESGEGFKESKMESSDEESCSSSSPALSMLTSGYGTYRPEEPEGADYRDDHTITEFDQDSQGDLSEMRDDEDDVHSFFSCGGEDTEPMRPSGYEETLPGPALEDGGMMQCTDDDPHLEMDNKDITDMKSEGDNRRVKSPTHEDEDQHSNRDDKDAAHVELEEEDKVSMGEKNLESGHEAEAQQLREGRDVEEGAEDEESSCNDDIKFIDSKVDFSCVTYETTFLEWEGNLRQKKGE